MRKKQKMMKEEGFFSNFVFINERERKRLERESSVHEQASHADLFSSFIPRSKRTTRMTSVKHITVVTVASAPVNSTSHVEEVNKNRKRVCSDDGEEKGSSKKRMKKNEKTTTCVLLEDPAPAPQLPANFRAKIEGLNGSEIMLVFQKKLFDSDGSKGQCRLLMPHKQIKTRGFLTPEERDGLNKIGGKIQHKEVLLIDPSCQKEWIVSLKIWEMGKSGDDQGIRVNYVYSLGKNWYKIVQSNGLKTGMIVQLWAFRVESNLHFALVKVGTPSVPPEENGGQVDYAFN